MPEVSIFFFNRSLELSDRYSWVTPVEWRKQSLIKWRNRVQTPEREKVNCNAVLHAYDVDKRSGDLERDYYIILIGGQIVSEVSRKDQVYWALSIADKHVYDL